MSDEEDQEEGQDSEALRWRDEGRPAIEVYISQNGHICIRQEDRFGEEEDPFIYMHPDQVPTVIGWLQEALAEVEDD